METLPRRRRMRWWGWLLTILGTILCLAVSAWFGWGYVGQKRLDELTADIRSRGEPLDWKDLAGPPVPDDQNAVPLYVRAHGLINEPTSKYSQADVGSFRDMMQDLVRNAPFRRQHPAEVAAIIDFSREPLALLRQAAGRPGADFNIDFNASPLEFQYPPLANMI
ncbi:MAG: hypothetical protein NTV86_12450, partial [Planctomycetota bacterium]|nr:hypothetical protein [Planctomycetota bacterium]